MIKHIYKGGGFTEGNMPAFPVADVSTHSLVDLNDVRRLSGGMTLRQYVAIHAPVDLVSANESLHQTATFGKPDDNGAFPMRLVLAEQVRLSVMYADMLLAELAKDQGAPAQTQSLSDKDPA